MGGPESPPKPPQISAGADGHEREG